MMSEAIDTVASAMRAETDGLVLDAIERRLGHRPSVFHLAGRITRQEHCGWTTIFLDGEWLVRLGPVETEVDGTHVSASRRVETAP